MLFFRLRRPIKTNDIAIVRFTSPDEKKVNTDNILIDGFFVHPKTEKTRIHIVIDGSSGLHGCQIMNTGQLHAPLLPSTAFKVMALTRAVKWFDRTTDLVVGASR